MTIELPLIDEGQYAAVATLTHKERQCLAGWLARRTAKQIALDLGITYHAVEKRLKSARAKLGVRTSLDAALLLAAVEQYHRTVSQSPDMASLAANEEQDVDRAVPPWWTRLSAQIFAGVIIMSLFLLAALAFQPAPQSAPSTQKVVVLNRADGTSTDLATALGGVFGKLDKNGDGFIAGGELTGGRFQVTRTTIAKGDTAPKPTATTLSDFDADRDGRVSEAEFRTGMANLARPRG